MRGNNRSAQIESSLEPCVAVDWYEVRGSWQPGVKEDNWKSWGRRGGGQEGIWISIEKILRKPMILVLFNEIWKTNEMTYDLFSHRKIVPQYFCYLHFVPTLPHETTTYLFLPVNIIHSCKPHSINMSFVNPLIIHPLSINLSIHQSTNPYIYRFS